MTFLYTAYVLIWPALTLGVLAVICRAVWRDYRTANREGRGVV
ncbi:MAG TPA: putative transporter small subunit [Candidatus Halomonas stercoripullorum]|uniref:Transporter small subunit n=2 Tax=Candidatus Halomonas stercoripullorum TaxID=2838617 RepID=A0A9D2B4V2_9GAMM|nr:putative transporter small subunit [Candidatus Halomonas stercoripullorum]